MYLASNPRSPEGWGWRIASRKSLRHNTPEMPESDEMPR